MPLVSMPDVPDGPVYRQQQQKCWFSLLMNHCLHFIDKNASAVLASEVRFRFNCSWIPFRWNSDENLSSSSSEVAGSYLCRLVDPSIFFCCCSPLGLDEISQTDFMQRLNEFQLDGTSDEIGACSFHLHLSVWRVEVCSISWRLSK